ncbi:hypothetical protein AU509_05940 [Lonsdalea britannica]|uniref:DUF3053 domain-containing protein n=1 Tax=Lonsdalea britannica TaxID=1082704 RepID=A0AAD0WKB4_9GAMM|nr:DUF3053 domain-containing protein [Lonsdalea britannica]AXW86510.1 DUF3053 domain-containing protein [Lonsdalea britannica]OSM98715.1 hypothetical protein AU509_05940 [Lonsdalea britannica]
MLADIRSRWLMPVIMVLMTLQLAACGDKDKEQRQAFNAFLQGVEQEPGRQLPGLTDQQKQSFGRYAQDYAILTGFSQQLDQALAGSLTPMLEQVARIRVPQDYLTERENLRQSTGALNLLSQQTQTAKVQADNARHALKQPEDVQAVYNRVYERVVTKPATAVAAVVPVSLSFAQTLVQVGDYLQTQGAQVTFNGNGVQFQTQAQVDQYNGMMTQLSSQQQNLATILKAQPLIAVR